MSNLKQHYFNNFTRVNEAVHPQAMKPEELVTLDNMRLDDKVAAAVSRKGFDRYHLQTNSSGAITSLFDVKDANDNNYLLAQVGTALRKSLDGSGVYSTIKTGLTNAKMRMGIYGENFFFTNGNDNPFYSDLSSANTFDLSLETPDVTGMTYSMTFGTGGYVFYKYFRYLVQYITDDGQVSNLSTYFEARYFDVSQDGSTSTRDLAGIPVPTDSRIVSKKLYRTKNGELENFYLIATLDPATTTYTDDVLDSTLLSEDVLDYITPISWSKYIAANTERLFFGNINKEYTNRIIPPGFSNDTIINTLGAGNVEDGLHSWGVTYIDIHGNESAMTIVVTGTLSGGPYSVNIEHICMPYTRYTYNDTGSAILGTTLNSSIKAVRLYRTKAGTATPFYLVDEIDITEMGGGNTNSWISDNIADNLLGAVYAGVGTVELKSTVVYSNPFAPIEIPETNLIEIFPDDNDPITGILNDDNGEMIFKERSICKLYTNGSPTNWQVAKLVTDIGCDEPDSLYKHENLYYFFYKKRPYVFNGRSVQNIGESRKNTFDSITSVKGATYWNKAQFYVVAVTIGTEYYLMAYDTKLQGWYKWSISKADAVITKLFGDDKDKLLFGRNTYVTYYNEDIDYDNDTGARAEIMVNLKTKDYRVDGFANQRLWMLYIDYKKKLNRITDNIIFTLTNPQDPSTLRTYDDNASVVVENKFKIPPDAMMGLMKRARVINFSFSGTSMDEFVNGRLDYMIENWGVERRDPGDISGLGVKHGSEAGVSD